MPLLTNTYSASIGRIVTHYYSKNKKKLHYGVFLPCLRANAETCFFSAYTSSPLGMKAFFALSEVEGRHYFL
ncbi:MAG: hypothetical protein A2Z38_05975 [Planctomycetes bacterium RBG_19FT_COMBO_48_8]|nr:MAG: hypothetical protein A2Z38_05975 [Planctomycetes bacterium RBG_19FT_COMBO_48_8]